MNITDLKIDGYERVAKCVDEASGLHAIIAVHNTKRGPALGGVRMQPYTSEEDALNDVLRLSRAMTYKSASVDLNLGGGKAVIIGNPETGKTDALLHAMGKFINELNGTYFSAKDAGIITSDLVTMSQTCHYVTGLPGGSGDPSHLTADGVVAGMETCVKNKLHKESLVNVHVAIQGLGHVGYGVAERLKKRGAKITVTDIYDDAVKKAVKELGAKAVSPESIHRVECDIFSPCALGAGLNDQTIPKLNCSIVAGAANNQLLDEKIHGQMLFERNILYAQDYMINAGGVINIYVIDILKETHPEKRLKFIQENLEKTFALSASEGIPIPEAANRLTEAKL